MSVGLCNEEPGLARIRINMPVTERSEDASTGTTQIHRHDGKGEFRAMRQEAGSRPGPLARDFGVDA